MLERLRAWLEPRAHYAGVVAASVIFGSWVVTNFLSESVTRAQQRIGVISSAQIMVNWQRSVDTKLGNLEKLVLRARDLTVPADIEALSPSHHRLYNWSLELGFVGSFLDDWTNLNQQAQLLDGLCRTTGAPVWITWKVSTTRERVASLYGEYVRAKDTFDKVAEPLRGGMPYSKIPATTADQIADAAERYRNTIRGSAIEFEYIHLKNALLASEADLRRWSSFSLTLWSVLSDIFRIVALVLYAIGTLLAIYGKWVEATAKARESKVPAS